MMLSVGSADAGSPPERETPRTRRGWAVVEIMDDGTLGRTEVVSAAEPSEAAVLAQVTAPDALAAVDADLTMRLGLVQAASGHLHEARRTLLRALDLTAGSPQLEDCLGPLALIEAFQGRLDKASGHAEQALATGRACTAGTVHALLAKAWTHLERADFVECEQSLDLAQSLPIYDRGPWVETVQILAEAKLLAATARPDAAVGVLASGVDTAGTASGSGWIRGVIDAARAEALLASGEPRRALAAVTPLSDTAMVEASVAAAAARREIGDVRGANAVLDAVVGALERSPLALQIHAWVLESRLAEDAGNHRRSWLLVDRALRAATAEQLRTPLRDDWQWLRAFLDREPHLMHRHRAFIVGLESVHARSAAVTDAVVGTTLTHRECEVLELLAQMYSTEEIARTLYVSGNTVKTHVKGIFGKLCVNRRVDAVRKGRSLGLC